MDRSRGKIMTYQFLTAFPQMISRITHTNKEVQEVLVKLVYRVIRDYPLQALWPTIGAVHSNKKDRRELADAILRKSVVSRSGNETDYRSTTTLASWRRLAMPSVYPKHYSCLPRTSRRAKCDTRPWRRTTRTCKRSSHRQ